MNDLKRGGVNSNNGDSSSGGGPLPPPYTEEREFNHMKGKSIINLIQVISLTTWRGSTFR